VKRRNRFVEFLSEISLFLYRQKNPLDVGSCFLTCRQLKVFQFFISFLFFIVQVQALVDERIEKRLNEKDLVMAEMKSNMRLLWAEVEALNKGRDHLQEHVNHLTKVAKLAKENANREQDIFKSENGFLRRQLQSFKSNAGCSSS
jgi:hypothetical protein